MDVDGVLRQIADVWLRRIEDARVEKERTFGKTARLLWKFLTRSYRDIYITAADINEQSGAIPPVLGEEPLYKPRINKCREFVSIYLPYIAARVPTRVVNSKRPAIAGLETLLSMDGAVHWAKKERAAKLLEWWLNYCAGEVDLETVQRQVVQEALVKGRGVVWTELIEHGSRILISSSPDSVDNFLVDADARTLTDCGFVVRRRIEPPYVAQERLGLTNEETEQLVSNSARRRLRTLEDVQVAREMGKYAEYYEVYSRIGIGRALDLANEDLRNLKEALDSLGAHVWLVLAEGFDYPINLRHLKDSQPSQSELQRALEWPIALWGDPVDPWPCTVLDFMPNIDNPWATSPLEAGLPMQVFLDHIYAYIMGRARLAARTIVVTSRAMDPRLHEKLLDSGDYEVVTISQEQIDDIQKMYNILQLPAISGEVLQLIPMVERAFERAVGLDALLYGAAPRPTPRSAQEVMVRQQFLHTRPNDYADCVERWSSRAAAKEGVATRLYINSEVVAPVFGELPTAAQSSPALSLWDDAIFTDDPIEAAAEYTFSVVEGSGRRKNREALAQIAQSIAQTFGSQAVQLLSAGNVEPYNKIVALMGEALDTDLSAFMMAPQPPGTSNMNVPGRLENANQQRGNRQ
ncbi:MAG: hypothetical protein ONB06_04035 [candidate division KSB1 bacterium]|nr:hypothetical protein [candidate division KSB1 bacterium]